MNQSVPGPRTIRSHPTARVLAALACAAVLVAAGTASAAGPHGGFAGGGFARGGGGFARGGFARGGYGRPYGYGWHGGGWGGYGWPGYGWGWGLGLGLGLGVYLSTLPWNYSTYWWDGVPYYYASDHYYEWDPSVNEYQQVQPPAQLTQRPGSAPDQSLFAYPKNGQSVQQQAQDAAECRQWAGQQVNSHAAPPASAQDQSAAPAANASQPGVGAPPTATGALADAVGAPASDAAQAAEATGGSPFLRAEAACLTGRGYSVD